VKRKDDMNDRIVESVVDEPEVVDLDPQVVRERFRRSPFEGLDRRFLSILLISFVVHFSIALYFVINPPPAEFSQEEIEKIQKRYVKLVLNKEVPKEEKVQKVEGLGKETGTPEKPKPEEKPKAQAEGKSAKAARKSKGPVSAEARAAARRRAAAARRQTRAQIAKQASSAGVLALLTGAGNSSAGDGVEDVLNDVGNLNQDLDTKLSQVGGLKTRGKPGSGSGNGDGSGRAVRGGRATSLASIDDLVSGLSEAEAASLKRSGDLIVSSASPVEGGPGAKAGSRDPDAVSAIVNKHNSAIQYCYQRALRRNPDLKGKLVVRFTITPEGRVKNVEVVSTTLTDKSVIDCVVSRIRRWSDFGAIDPSKGDATFRQVYAFGY